MLVSRRGFHIGHHVVDGSVIDTAGLVLLMSNPFNDLVPVFLDAVALCLPSGATRGQLPSGYPERRSPDPCIGIVHRITTTCELRERLCNRVVCYLA